MSSGRLLSLFVILCALAAVSACWDDTSSLTSGDSAATGDESLAGFYLVAQRTRTLDDSPRDLLPGFAFEIKNAFTSGGATLGVSRLGELIPLAELKRATPSSFQGIRDPDPALRLAFVFRAQAPVLREPNEHAKVVSRLPRLSAVPLLSRDGPSGYFRTRDGWLSTDDIRVPTPSHPPVGVADSEAWIDVDLNTQTLVLYKGRRPVFVTLISGGVGTPGSTFATPLGQHRIISKFRSATMDNLEHTNVVPYYYETVPFTQYIGRVGLHAVYWHDDFGRPKSHGCINLSMGDAEYLFQATTAQGERTLPGQKGARGTLVQVR